MKGIVLAGGSGTRLYPAHPRDLKQLLPVYDKPMIYYPLSTLMLAGIRDILVISTPTRHAALRAICSATAGNGGSRFSYAVQPSPDGLAQAFIIGREFVGRTTVCAGAGRQHLLRRRVQRAVQRAAKQRQRGHGVRVLREGPGALRRRRARRATARRSASKRSRRRRKSNFAVTGLYFYDNQVIDIARQLAARRRAASSRSPTSTPSTCSASSSASRS